MPFLARSICAIMLANAVLLDLAGFGRAGDRAQRLRSKYLPRQTSAYLGSGTPAQRKSLMGPLASSPQNQLRTRYTGC
ncbi:uncharacterized protein E0L32_012361 [Thyridium curvatum]|uniref:Secreted protein n=1 Tax=Thyridium curvatum TaxID=1093900 RepID=A0A507BHJ2_9PEZI|nr:uncharacterized protein E0L32_012361 [Thyridium curvatum]TPX16809.1 hypothetical protein E0L32_012361 [Thyridium curvatum]